MSLAGVDATEVALWPSSPTLIAVGVPIGLAFGFATVVYLGLITTMPLNAIERVAPGAAAGHVWLYPSMPILALLLFATVP